MTTRRVLLGDRCDGVDIKEMIGETFVRVETVADGGENVRDQIAFYVSDGHGFLMYHEEDCCERVAVDDVVGDLDDLVGSAVVRAEKPSSLDGFNEKRAAREDDESSFTWTFYILGTAKGTVTIRWYGSSNGYYSESVTIRRFHEEVCEHGA